jgi:hypothetical protein
MNVRTIGAAAISAAALLTVAVTGTASAASSNVPTPVSQVPVKIVHEAAPPLKPGGIRPMHISETDHVWGSTYEWGANVTVDYGLSGAVTGCSDGTVIYGPLVGPGYWQFGGNCYGHGYFSWYDFYSG